MRQTAHMNEKPINMSDTTHQVRLVACEHDIEFDSGIKQSKRQNSSMSSDKLLDEFEAVLGVKNIIADPKHNAHYRKGWRSGEGSALAVVFPQSLLMLWNTLKVAVQHNLIIVMQAANTGLTEGSSPSGDDYDRPVIIINTLALDDVYLVNQGQQLICMPGTTLHQVETSLGAINRAPHSVIGSSCLGASVVGGIANNSGGALVKRGPAYTELSLYAKIDEHGRLILVNHLGIDLGDNPDEIINRLSSGSFVKDGLIQGNRVASDQSYAKRVKDVDSPTPSRFNADPRRLFEASGCAGKLAVFAVRVDSHPIAKEEASFYIGTNDPNDLYALRRILLTQLDDLPDVGEYMHRDIFDIAERYGKDTFLSVLHLGTQRLPKLFASKSRIDSFFNKLPFLPKYFCDRILQALSKLFVQHLPERLLLYRDKYEHHLVIKLSDNALSQARILLFDYFNNSQTGNYFECTEDEAKRAYLHRFAAAGAALRYQLMHHKTCGEILSLDIALPRNEINWVESFDDEIEQHIDKKLYYGHFFCYVFHQDYILKKGSDPLALKKLMLEQLDKRGAKYPAEHNVGHLYEAEQPLKEFYQHLDPTNSFNPGIGKMEKTQRNCDCCF